MNFPARLAGTLMLLGLLAVPFGEARADTTCQATSTDLAFGAVDANGMVSAQATVMIDCSTRLFVTLGTVVSVRACLHLGDGVTGTGHFNPRRMTNAEGDPLHFQLYQDPGHSVIWGSRSLPALPDFVTRDFQYNVTGFTGGTSRTVVIYGQVPVQDALAAGSYSNPFTGVHTLFEFQATERRIGSGTYPTSCTTGGEDGGGTGNFPFTVSANVPPQCSFRGITDLDFGAVPGLIDSHRDQTSSISLACTGRTPWAMSLDNGQNAVRTQRRMRRATSGDFIGYQLFRDPQRTQRWGGTTNVIGTGTGTTQAVTVYGRVFGGQAVPAGRYRDVITVTVTY